MNRPGRVILATWFAMIAATTIGSVDSKRKLPAPKNYAAVSVLWGILFLMHDTGLGRLAARLSLLVLLTASVIGPFGKRFITFLEMVAKRFAVAPGTGSGPVPTSPTEPSIIPGGARIA
jgi:hypothetical protein